MIFVTRCLPLFAGMACCAAAETVSFNREIRPILSDNCYACHGFDPKTGNGALWGDLKNILQENSMPLPAWFMSRGAGGGRGGNEAEP